MILAFDRLKALLIQRARTLAEGCGTVFVSVSGGIDSSLVAAILCDAFGPDNVVCMHRTIKSDPKHLKDVKLLKSVFGFKLIIINADRIYDEFLHQAREQFASQGLPWAEENTDEAHAAGFTNAYGSLKSRFTTPFAGFIAKAVDAGRGRIFGTGNGEEDGLLRYFDKYGDGAVDSNILNGLTKAEVRQMARHMRVPESIILKTPSADLEATGDKHNDEEQLTQWAQKRGFDIKVSYGACDGSCEGNIAWAWKQDIKHGVITGTQAAHDAPALRQPPFGYTDEQLQTILFLREVESATRHKVQPISGLPREILTAEGLVD